MAGTVLRAHLIEGQTLKDLVQALNCNRSSLRIHLHKGVQLLRHWAQRDDLMPIQTS